MESIVKSVNPDNGFSFAVVLGSEPNAAALNDEQLRKARCLFRDLAGDVGADEIDDGVAVAFAFGGADAGDALEFVERGGRDVGQGIERDVGEHHVGGHRVGLGPV